MRQRYLRLISVLLLLAVLTACGTDREGAAGGTVEGVVNRNGDFLVLLTDEGEYQTFEFGAGVDTGALEEGDCVPSPIPESWQGGLHANGRKYFQTIGERAPPAAWTAGGASANVRNQGLSALCLKSRKGAVSFP
ncbi:MAG: hypothetical protein ACLT5P_07770 [Flavonifractor plautii]